MLPIQEEGLIYQPCNGHKGKILKRVTSLEIPMRDQEIKRTSKDLLQHTFAIKKWSY